MKKEKREKNTEKKPFYKKWWFWVIIVIVLIGIFGSGGKDKDTVQTASENEPATTTEPAEENKQMDSDKGEIEFMVSDVRNDVTGKWRISLIAENIEPKDYALDYYKKYFKSDDEIHAIVNFNYKTTTKLSVVDKFLNVTIYEYVDKEEHDANLLFSGMLLDEYSIDIDSGEILDAQGNTSTKEVSPDDFITDVKGAIQGAINSETESIKDVVLNDDDLCVYVDFSNTDPSPLTLEDLALSRTSSITDEILDFKDYDSLWNTITIDFGEVGKIINTKESMKENGVGRYFPTENFKLQ